MEELFRTGFWRVTRERAAFPDGREVEDVRVHRPDTVRILAFPTPETILAIREYRPYYGMYVWMLPGGKADEGEDVTQTARRQLREEAGYEPLDLQPWCTAYHVENVPMTNHFFIATKLKHDPLPQQDDELIELHELPFGETLENILSSSHVHLASSYGMLRYQKEFILNA